MKLTFADLQAAFCVESVPPRLSKADRRRRHDAQKTKGGIPAPGWKVTIPGPPSALRFTVRAWSASEARARIKQELRLARLPVGSSVHMLEEAP